MGWGFRVVDTSKSGHPRSAILRFEVLPSSPKEAVRIVDLDGDETAHSIPLSCCLWQSQEYTGGWAGLDGCCVDET